jgi:asparagine synthase (glutamine-hydrolysing)
VCGITGFWGTLAAAPDAAVRLGRMTAAVRHRGPDGEAHWLGGDVALGHTRLAIIDVAGGAQPMRSADGQSVIVFNGEIYNHHELRQRLEQQGVVFHTRSDTEVIGAALAAWGLEAGLLSLRGMFAFALYHLPTHRLLLARDRVGIKPLYWAEIAGGIAFGSEQKAILAADVIPRQVNPVAVHDFLGMGYPTTPETCWKGMQMLEPGAWLEISPRGVRRGRYWTWSPHEDHRLDLDEATALTERTLLDAAQAHLVSDVPVGAFLSGGLDSSLLVSLLSPSVVTTLPTFTVGFSDAGFDESQAARSVAAACGTVHHELHLGGGTGDPNLFQQVLNQYDEPFGDSSALPVYLICREMRKHVKVVLSGDGGDEVLGGYPRYLHARRLATLSRFPGLLPAASPFIRLARGGLRGFGRQVDKAFRLARLGPVERLCALHTYFDEEERAGLYQHDFARQALSRGPTSTRFAAFLPENQEDPALQLITAELRLRLHADYLRKVDVASAAHGVEVRVPYLDHAMLDLAARLPTRFKVTRHGETKIISRRLARRRLPPEVAAAPKRGFSIPFDQWAGPDMHDFLRSLLLDRDAAVTRVLRPAAVQQVWDDFTGDASQGGISRYQRFQRLFMITSLALWLKRWNPALA